MCLCVCEEGKLSVTTLVKKILKPLCPSQCMAATCTCMYLGVGMRYMYEAGIRTIVISMNGAFQ